MKHYLKPVIGLATFTFLIATTALAETEEKMVIASKTDQFELTETDISTLAIGEAQTIETDSGKVIDILRTVDGVEIYVDGELLDLNFNDQGLHEEHMIRKHVEVICDSDDECDKNVIILASDDDDIFDWVTEDGEMVIIHKEIELSCSDEEQGASCSDQMIWVSEGEDIDLDVLHQMHLNGEGHKVIVIRKEVVKGD